MSMCFVCVCVCVYVCMCVGVCVCVCVCTRAPVHICASVDLFSCLVHNGHTPAKLLCHSMSRKIAGDLKLRFFPQKHKHDPPRHRFGLRPLTPA